MLFMMMMRHGRAVSREEAGSDEARWLTEEGRREAEAGHGYSPSSPLLSTLVLSVGHGRPRTLWHG